MVKAAEKDERAEKTLGAFGDDIKHAAYRAMAVVRNCLKLNELDQSALDFELLLHMHSEDYEAPTEGKNTHLKRNFF
jgi:hypothetical protein